MTILVSGFLRCFDSSFRMASVFEFLILLAAGQQSETNDVARKQAT
jgi:hypothetical protein